MRKSVVLLLCALAFACAAVFAGCSSSGSSASSSASQESASAAAFQATEAAASSTASESSGTSPAPALESGEYQAEFKTDSSMFHVNEADDGMGALTVSDDGMSIHVRLVSKKIVNLYPGTADEAQSDAQGILNPTSETVTYSDGYEEEVYAFDIPVPALDQDFDVAILGEKGKWYDHKVSVVSPK